MSTRQRSCSALSLNTIGLRRADIRGERYRKLEQMFRKLREGKPFDDLKGTPEIDYLRSWMLATSKRGVYSFLKPKIFYTLCLQIQHLIL